MDRHALTDRTVTYGDTLGEPDIRLSVANVAGIALSMNAIPPIVGTYELLWPRRYEQRLRGATGEGDAPEGGVLVDRFGNALFRVRLGLSWVFCGDCDSWDLESHARRGLPISRERRDRPRRMRAER